MKEQATKAKENADQPKKGFEDYFEGMIMAYYSIITLFKHEALALCIDQKELGLAEIKPEADLLGLHRNPNVPYGEDNWSIDPMTEENMSGYLLDTIALLKEQAQEAKKDIDNSEMKDLEYNQGHLMAYFATFSLLKQQAQIFDIDQKEIGLEEIEPEVAFLDFDVKLNE